MNTSLATSKAVKSTNTGLAYLWQYITATILPSTVNTGAEPPAAANKAKPWVQPDGTVFTWNDTNSNWYARMPIQVGTVSLFLSTSPVSLGWEADSGTGVSVSGGYAWRKFSGTGLIVVGNFALRRYDQSI